MAEKFIGDFHKPSTDGHPGESIGNQQIWIDNKQVGSLEYIPTGTGDLKISIYDRTGEKVTDM